MIRIRARAGLAVLCALGAGLLHAQSFPSKPVRFVVPFAPGGQSDVVARTVGQKLAERWGQPVVIDNKPGAATTIGADFVAKSPADGHTILLSPAPFVITQYAYPKLPYDSRRDFTPVTLLVTNPLVVTVNPARMPVRSVADFVAMIRKDPGKLSYGTPGNGSLPHLAVELFRLQSGIDAIHVPYKGGGPAVLDLVGGQIAFMFASPLEVMPNVKAGKLNVLAVSSARRVSYWPEVPTLKEAGFPQYEAYAWFGVTAPAATPRDVVARLNADIVAALKSPDVAERLAAQGADVAGSTIEEFARFLDAEHGRWSAAVKAANVVVQ
ncbi:MAG: tripartite tricarboxylate transporter substrate binding protein [Burkholderiales bacterium]|nr:tripartite tricarboxylate transporter substrate binding protein [Burkholderiales bacterium]